jgi:hypothetical protein
VNPVHTFVLVVAAIQLALIVALITVATGSGIAVCIGALGLLTALNIWIVKSEMRWVEEVKEYSSNPNE